MKISWYQISWKVGNLLEAIFQPFSQFTCSISKNKSKEKIIFFSFMLLNDLKRSFTISGNLVIGPQQDRDTLRSIEAIDNIYMAWTISIFNIFNVAFFYTMFPTQVLKGEKNKQQKFVFFCYQVRSLKITKNFVSSDIFLKTLYLTASTH